MNNKRISSDLGMKQISIKPHEKLQFQKFIKVKDEIQMNS